MLHCFASLCLLFFLSPLVQCTVTASEFHLEGDYVIGGLFDIHHVSVPVFHNRPEAVNCSSHLFILPNYRKFQLMRFAVEQINSLTTILPDVSLGYEIFSHCSDTHIFPGILKLISRNDMVQPWGEPFSKMIAVVGPYTSTDTLTVAAMFMMNLIPMVSYGAAATTLTEENQIKFPSFLRTVHPNKNMIEVIVQIILHFKWHWVAFLNTDNDFGIDGLEMFRKRIENTEICLAYSKSIRADTNYSQMFHQIEAQKIHTIIAFVTKVNAEALIKSAIQLNISDKVWIGGDTWSLNQWLPKEKEITKIGTILGVSQPVVPIPGFDDFMYSNQSWNHCGNAVQQAFCNQACNCNDLSAEDVLLVDPSFSFSVYSAVYAIANALHKVLKCGTDKCNGNVTAYPHTVLEQLKKSDFTLLNHRIQFDENGDPMFGSYSIVFWNHTGDVEEVGFYRFHQSVKFYIDNSKIQWFTKGEVPSSLCSQECPVGYAKRHNGIHKCCFTCEICARGTYVNSTDDPYTCLQCNKETEWSAEGSTSCNLREVEYIPFTDTGALLIMVGTLVFVALTLAMSVLFAINYNTPVVRSAGGPTCFLILGCLSLSSLSVFFYFGKPTVSFCILRFLPFLLFYTVCLACFVVRSFQIVCIFKMAAKFPKLHGCWMKYHGQWLIISLTFVIQAGLLVCHYSFDPPKPYNDTVWYPDKIILGCDINLESASGSMVILLSLCLLSFIFSYMGKDLPKDYNEAKSITFCLMLLILTWIIFTTVFILYNGKYIQILNALAVLSSLYSFLLWYFIPKCHIIIFQPHKNTKQHFQGAIQNYTKTISQ